MKKGYKQTEVGVIPEDWEVKPLENVTRGIHRGASPRPIDNPVWFDDKSNIGWVRISDVTSSGRYLLTTVQRLSRQGISRSRFVPSGSLIMSICATVGRPIETKIDVCIHDGFVFFDKPRVLQGFLYHLLKLQEPIWSAMGQTGSQMNLNTMIIDSTKVPIPKTELEQKTIATALSDADILIETLAQLIAKKREIKKAVMQELLKPKNDWVNKTLGDVGEFQKGCGVKKEEAMSGSLPCVRYGEIYTTHNDYIREFTSWISRDVAKTARLVKYGDILFAGSGETKEEIGKSVAFLSKKEAYAGGDIVILRPYDTDALFLGYYLNSESIVQQKKSKGQGDAVVHISAASLAMLEVLLPPIQVQKEIGKTIKEMDIEIDILELKLNKYKSIKQAMMQELLTGRIRLV